MGLNPSARGRARPLQLRSPWEPSLADFERHRLWVVVHNVDLGKPSYEACDELASGPWTEPLQAATDDTASYLSMLQSSCWTETPTQEMLRQGGEERDVPLPVQRGFAFALLGLKQPKILRREKR